MRDILLYIVAIGLGVLIGMRIFYEYGTTKQTHFISLPDPEEFKHVAPGDHLTIRIDEDTTKVEFTKTGGMMVIP